ncbi:unnamed protein product [Leptosia nina]|uniref:Uncharacterized protein n=1 Tax=Leptosia nina TaxID=320188 RepID=A0AAV1JZZ9_9NEOP
MPSRVFYVVLYITVCLNSSSASNDEARDFFEEMDRIPNSNRVINAILDRLERNQHVAARFRQRQAEEDCDHSSEALPEYTETIEPTREREMRQLNVKKHYPICHFDRKIQRLNTLDYEYRPAYYEEIQCLHSDFENTRDSNEICSSIGFTCVQWNKTIHLTRKRYNSHCWEALTMVIPAGCECMWPAHKLGDITLHA